jgi:hypothetical protein
MEMRTKVSKQKIHHVSIINIRISCQLLTCKIMGRHVWAISNNVIDPLEIQRKTYFKIIHGDFTASYTTY